MSISQAAFDGYGARHRIYIDNLIHLFQGDELMSAVGDRIKAVASAKHLQAVLRAYKLSHLSDRLGRVHNLRSVFEVPGPISQLVRICPHESGAKGTAGCQGGAQLQE